MKLELPEKELSTIHRVVRKNDPRVLKKAIIELSDHYISAPEDPTPWEKPSTEIAYWSYFHPLNLLRCLAVARRCQEVGFFEKIGHVHDFGCGLGAASKAISHLQPGLKYFAYDTEASRKHSDLSRVLRARYPGGLPHPKSQTDLLVASFSFTEMNQLPDWIYEFDSLLIVEPATKADGRRMTSWREEFLKRGYFPWAPCTHSEACPMTKSKRDWCHDKCRPVLPEWLSDLHAGLPMQNHFLSFNYLALKKTPPPVLARAARVTGDPQKEKGKTKQMLCYDSKKRFATWLHRHGTPETFTRGEQIGLQELESKENMRLN